MSDSPCQRLAKVLREERSGLLRRWREQVRTIPAARHLDVPTLTDHMPALIDELCLALELGLDEAPRESVSAGSSALHGLQRLAEAFDIVEVVAEYSRLRECVHDLAESSGVPLEGAALRITNRVLDNAIGVALETYATQRALEVQRRREEYLAFVAHDLRTPLNAIALVARILDDKQQRARSSGLASEDERMIGLLLRNVKQLENLVSKVLEENANLRTEIGLKLERRVFYLWPEVEGLVHDLHPIGGSASTTVVNEVPDELLIYADAALLRRVFQNLIANAIRYTPRGEIVIGARTANAAGDVECWVTDDGAGIPADLLPKIFEKGEADSDAGGLGLGLAIVKTFVEAHGGSVEVQSEVGAGSTFRILIPGKVQTDAPRPPE